MDSTVACTHTHTNPHTHLASCEPCEQHTEETPNKTDIRHPRHTCHFKHSQHTHTNTHTPYKPFQMEAAVRLLAMWHEGTVPLKQCLHFQCVCVCVCDVQYVCKSVISASLCILSTNKAAGSFISWDQF